MALNKQIIHESGTHAELQPGSGSAAELQPGMIGIATDRQQVEWREVIGVTMHTLLNFPDTGGVAGNILFQGANESAAEDSELFWDNTLKRLCVGGPTPKAQFTVYGNNSGIAAQALTYSLIEGTTDMYFGMLTLNTNTQGVLFGDQDDADVASVKYNHATGRMTFTCETAETLAITTGKLIVNRGVSAGTALATADELVVEGAADAGISIMTPDGSVARIAVSTASQSGFLQILFDIGNQKFEFEHAGLGTLLVVSNVGVQLEYNGTLIGSLAGSLKMQSTAGTTDLEMDGSTVTVGLNQDLKLGRPAGNGNAVDQQVYGQAAWDKFVPIKDSAGATYYLLATTTNPT